jgi:hypothetical protein
MSYEDWLEALSSMSEKGRRISENVATDRVLPNATRAEFEKRVEMRWSSGADPVDVLLGSRGSPPALVFRGHTASLPTSTDVTTFVRDRDIPNDWRSRAGSHRNFLRFVRDVISKGVRVDLRLGGPHATSMVWYTFLEEVERARGAGEDLTRLRDRLGLTHIRPGSELAQLSCAVGDAGDLHVPSVLDAGDHAAFKPAATASEPWGTTRDTRGEEGLPEVVGAPIELFNLRVENPAGETVD